MPASEYARVEVLRKAQLFCYEVLLPPTFTFVQGYRKMQADVCNYFGVQAGIEKRRMPVLRLAAHGVVKTELQPGGEEEIGVSDDRLNYTFRHCTIRRMVELLNYHLELPPVITGTSPQGTVNVSFRLSSRHDLTGLQKGLQSIGLSVARSAALIDMFVVRNGQ